MADAKAGGPGDRLTAIMDEVLAFRDARDWRQFHAPKELASALGIEAGELQELFLWRGIETAEEVRADAERMAEIRDEACIMRALAVRTPAPNPMRPRLRQTP